MLSTPSQDQLIAAQAVKSFAGKILDIRTHESYKESHIEGAQNFSVYQTDFLEKIPEAYPDKTTRFLIYGEGGSYKADQAALGRLQLLGYSNVSLLDGGLASWREQGLPLQGDGTPKAHSILSGEIALNTPRSKVRWVGRNLMNQHNGEILPKEGFLLVSENGDPVSGSVTVDMAQIVCYDIAEKPLAQMLVDHLESIDFFDVRNHATASFDARKFEHIDGSSYGKPNYFVTGSLTARGITIPLSIEALVEPIDEGYVFQSTFHFDRTEVGALYGSGSIFERLGMHLVNDNVSIDVTAFFLQA